METTTQLNNLKRRLILAFGVGLCLTIFGIISPNRAHATENQEQVVVSPAQQAVNTALATATTEVQQAIAATDTATATVAVAQTQLSQAQAAVDTVTATIEVAQDKVSVIQSAINTVNSIDTSTAQVNQSSEIIIDAKTSVVNATNAINNIDTATAQVQISEAITAKTEASIAQANAQTELTQANIAIDNAQTAVNNLQATIGNTTNVLAGVDDAGVKMNLPFSLLMGETLYQNVYVGSNATITFGVNEGANYYSTPSAPSISIAGWDWTTWSTGTGITYATTGSSLDIAWDVRPFPQQDASTQMVQVRFNADINPANGAWRADVTATGPIPNGARFNYRETTNGAITNITDTNAGSGFSGVVSQGPAFTPIVDSSTATVQAAVDAANATITALNQSLSPVVAQNTTNTSAINAINTTSLTNTINAAVATKTNLQTTLNAKAEELTTVINNNIPTPAPILSEPVVEGTTVTIAPELPQGYTANTWFYQVITDDPNAENPYAGGTYNTDGASESIELTGLTEGATYTVRIANWSGPVSQYSEVIVSIPAPEETVVTPAPQPVFIYAPEQNLPDETNLNEEGDTEQEQNLETPSDDTTSGDDGSQDTDTPESDESSSSDEQDNTPAENKGTDQEDSQDNNTLSVEEIQEVVSNLIEDGNITASDAEAVLDALSADGQITNAEVANLSEVLAKDGKLTLAEKDLLSDALVQAADGAPVEASAIKEAGLEYRDLPPLIPVEVREDINGNPVVITAEVASALLTLESPAALVNAISGCFNPEEAIEGLTEEQKCEVFKALANIGADMSPQERQKAKEVLVAAVLVGQVILGSSIMRIRG